MPIETDLVRENRRYPNPPIVEAVINLHVTFPGGDVEPSLARAAKTFADFGRAQDLNVVDLNVQEGKDGQIRSDTVKKRFGLKFSNEANDRILQIRSEGFAYSHMSPYATWETFSTEARALWDLFADDCSPVQVTRIAIRYINRLKLPFAVLELADYLKFYPEVPASLGIIEGVLCRVQLPQPKVSPKSSALVTLATEPSVDANIQSLVLDIDVFDHVAMSPNDPRIWDSLLNMRDIKNHIFEESLTDKMKEFFL